ncbi:MAG: sigma-70 family RNA polymerase sigma factor [Planctomycetes bacterium]|nr:sigma-70 family RNA polymerase sigma factor [Planctomycetota bacterium]
MTIAQRADPRAPGGPDLEEHRGEDRRLAPGGGPASDPPTPPFAELVRSHQHMVWRYLRLLGADAHEADDLMQDSFVLLGEALQRGERVIAPPAYLRGVARNLLIASRRRQRRQPPTLEWADAVDRLAGEPHALEDARVEALRRCYERLAGRARSAIEWHHVDGVSYREAARRLGIQEQGIKSLLARARDALRTCIEQRIATEE